MVGDGGIGAWISLSRLPFGRFLKTLHERMFMSIWPRIFYFFYFMYIFIIRLVAVAPLYFKRGKEPRK